jgi:hypothetical protein
VRGPRMQIKRTFDLFSDLNKFFLSLHALWNTFVLYANKVTFPVCTKVVVFCDTKYLIARHMFVKMRLNFHAVTSLKSCKISSSTSFVYFVPKKFVSHLWWCLWIIIRHLTLERFASSDKFNILWEISRKENVRA